MADVAGGESSVPGIYWTKDTSDEDQPIVFVPGLTSQANMRMGVKPKAGSSEERLGKRQAASRQSQDTPQSQKPLDRPLAAGTVQMQTLWGLTPSLAGQQGACDAAEGRSASLKDLCPEDKRRIANLIQELARVSEEKDETVERLRVEQQTFEKKIQQLEGQNQLIIQERESLQQQYRECQELLALYQQYLSQQQEKLHRSLSQLSHSQSHQQASCPVSLPRPSPQPPCDERRTPPAPGVALDGSYLGLRPPGWGAACRGVEGASTLGASSVADQHRSSTSGRQGDALYLPFSSRGQEGGGPAEEPPGQAWGPQTGGSVPRPGRPAQDQNCTDGAPRGSGSAEPRLGPCSHRCRVEKEEGGQERALDRRATGPGESPWDRRRQKLLLQKMELEVEREKLQILLAQQEEKLLGQHRQLQQSRLDYRRFQDAAVAELEDTISGALLTQTGEQGCATDTSSTERPRQTPPEAVLLPGALLAEQQGRAPPAVEKVNGAGGAQAGRSRSWEEQPAAPAKDGLGRSRGAPALSRRDASTSPGLDHRKTAPMPTALFPAQPIPWTEQTTSGRRTNREVQSIDSSLIELLGALSPVSKPGQLRHSVQRRPHATPQVRPYLLSPRPPLSPWDLSPAPVAHDEELQESQILEEIFFIC
ncbi:protein hinderin isoform X2 [Lepisosteus oculatus]|uniref:protein hinderin isoform X2 n=1 Tax=Lepisosteus oculatus TaxID=7918 RepID=UPI00371A125C